MRKISTHGALESSNIMLEQSSKPLITGERLIPEQQLSSLHTSNVFSASIHFLLNLFYCK